MESKHLKGGSTGLLSVGLYVQEIPERQENGTGRNKGIEGGGVRLEISLRQRTPRKGVRGRLFR